MKKITKKVKIEEETKEYDLLYPVLSGVKINHIYKYIIDYFEDEVLYLKERIKEQKDYIKFETDSYRLQKKEVKAEVLSMSKNKKALEKELTKLKISLKNADQLKDNLWK
jgi:hypothetical protein